MFITGCLISFGRSGRIYVHAMNILHGVLVQVACPCTVSSLGTGIDRQVYARTDHCYHLQGQRGTAAGTVSIIPCPGQKLWAHAASRQPARRERFITLQCIHYIVFITLYSLNCIPFIVFVKYHSGGGFRQIVDYIDIDLPLSYNCLPQLLIIYEICMA